jgi:hypothetical protein
MFRKQQLFPSSSERRETPTLFCPLHKDNLTYFTFTPSSEPFRINQGRFEKKCAAQLLNARIGSTGRMDQLRNKEFNTYFFSPYKSLN